MVVHKRASSTREATRSKLSSFAGSSPPAPDYEAADRELDDEDEHLKDGLHGAISRCDVRLP
jgi:hypothetical protein